MSRRNTEDIPELHAAIRNGQFQDVRCLVSSGVDVNIKDKTNHRTPLMLCAMLDQEAWGVGIARLLLANGAMVGHTNRRGQSALIVACIFGRCELVRVFLKAIDYDPNHRDKHGNTALFYAASSGREDVVEALVECLLHFKLPLDRANKWSMAPYLEACRLGHERIAQFLEEHGSPGDVRDTVLNWGAAEWRHDHQQRVLVEAPKNKAYDKPWLRTNARSLKRTVSDVSTRKSSNGLPAISASGTSNRTDLEDDVFFPPSILISPTKSETSILIPPQPRNKPHGRELPSTSTKGRMLFKSWIEDFTKGNVIAANFQQVTTPPCMLNQSAPNVSSSCSLTGKLPRNQRNRHLSVDRRASLQNQDTFKQIFQRYEIQSSDSFRQRAKTPEASKVPEIHPEVHTDHHATKQGGKLTRQQSRMNIGASSRLSSSSSSMEITTGRRSKAADARHRGGAEKHGKHEDSASSVSSEDSSGAARMMMNAFRRRKSSVVSSLPGT